MDHSYLKQLHKSLKEYNFKPKLEKILKKNLFLIFIIKSPNLS